MIGNKRQFGIWFTKANPFNHSRISKWLEIIHKTNLPVIEPFAGSGNMVKMLPYLNWQGFYDIQPQQDYQQIHLRNSLVDFPKFSENGEKFQVAITNPPWLSKNSASRRRLDFDNEFLFDDLYKQALFQCLANCDYVMAIVPENFVKSGLFRDRLVSIIRLTSCIFGNETEHPSCIALFEKNASNDFEIWEGENFLGMYSNLINHAVTQLDSQNILPFKFNSSEGEIIMHGLDTRSGPTICFSLASSEQLSSVKRSDRHLCIIQIPSNLLEIDIEKFIFTANKILTEYRILTCDVGLSPTKSRRRDGRVRRRLDFDIARRILTLATE